MRGACLAGELSENDLHSATFQISLDHSEMSDVSGEPINIVDQHGGKQAFACIVAKTIEFWPGQNTSAPSLVLVDIGDLPNLFLSETFELLDLRVDGLPFPLFLR